MTSMTGEVLTHPKREADRRVERSAVLWNLGVDGVSAR